MDRYCTDDFYDGEADDVEHYDPDDWVLAAVTKRRKGKPAPGRGTATEPEYLCRWEGYEETTWEPRARLLDLGYLSDVQALDASLDDAVRKRETVRSRERNVATATRAATMLAKYRLPVGPPREVAAAFEHATKHLTRRSRLALLPVVAPQLLVQNGSALMSVPPVASLIAELRGPNGSARRAVVHSPYSNVTARITVGVSGKYEFSDGIWDGAVDNAGRCGFGTLTDGRHGTTFAGHFRNGQRQGYGVWSTPLFTFRGEFARDNAEGPGVLQTTSGASVTGAFVNGRIVNGAVKLPFTFRPAADSASTSDAAAAGSPPPETDTFQAPQLGLGLQQMASIMSVYTAGSPAASSFTVAAFLSDVANALQSQKAGTRNGWGTKAFSNGSYRGNLVDGERHGAGVYTWNDGRVYDGEWVGGRMDGTGTYTWKDGRVYTGAFRRDEIHGKGKYSFGDGSYYEGQFRFDLIDGHGVYVSDTGTRLEVRWEAVHPLDAVFLAVPAFAEGAAPAAPKPRRHHEDPRTAAMAVPSDLPPASLLTDPGVEVACVICRDERKTRAVVPCGHLCVCDECAGTGKVTLCPLCRVPVETLLRLYT